MKLTVSITDTNGLSEDELVDTLRESLADNGIDTDPDNVTITPDDMPEPGDVTAPTQPPPDATAKPSNIQPKGGKMTGMGGPAQFGGKSQSSNQ